MNNILFAAFGGLLVNGLALLELHGTPKSLWPDFKDFFYWLPFIAWPVVGAVLVIAYSESGTSLNPIVSINIGASAPLLIRGMVNANPFQSKAIDPGPGA